MDIFYGKLKTYELEQEHRAIIYEPGSIDNKSLALAKIIALVAHVPETSKVKVTSPKAANDILEAEIEEINDEADDSEDYTLEELQQLEDKIMAYLVVKLVIIDLRRIPSTSSRDQLRKFRKEVILQNLNQEEVTS